MGKPPKHYLFSEVKERLGKMNFTKALTHPIPKTEVFFLIASHTKTSDKFIVCEDPDNLTFSFLGDKSEDDLICTYMIAEDLKEFYLWGVGRMRCISEDIEDSPSGIGLEFTSACWHENLYEIHDLISVLDSMHLEKYHNPSNKKWVADVAVAEGYEAKDSELECVDFVFRCHSPYISQSQRVQLSEVLDSCRVHDDRKLSNSKIS